MILIYFLQKIPIKKFMIGYLGFLLIYASFSRESFLWLFNGLAVVFFYSVYDLLWTYFKKKIWYLPLSSIISGLILALVGMPNPTWAFVIFIPLLAVISKQFFYFGKNRHILNPTAFALVALPFFGKEVTWWAVNWNTTVIILIAFLGIYIVWKLRKWEIALSFLAIYLIFLSFITGSLYFQIWDGTLLFFAGIILIEPITSAFRNLKAKIVYGAFAGAFAGILTYCVSNSFSDIIQLLDPLLAGLLLANLLTSLLFI